MSLHAWNNSVSDCKQQKKNIALMKIGQPVLSPSICLWPCDPHSPSILLIQSVLKMRTQIFVHHISHPILLYVTAANIVNVVSCIFFIKKNVISRSNFFSFS